jgi:hypothetical protein
VPAVKARALSSHGNKVHMTGMGLCPMCVFYREAKGRRTVESKSDGILF